MSVSGEGIQILDKFLGMSTSTIQDMKTDETG